MKLKHPHLPKSCCGGAFWQRSELGSEWETDLGDELLLSSLKPPTPSQWRSKFLTALCLLRTLVPHPRGGQVKTEAVSQPAQPQTKAIWWSGALRVPWVSSWGENIISKAADSNFPSPTHWPESPLLSWDWWEARVQVAREPVRRCKIKRDEFTWLGSDVD